jgi:hypothetical protein
VPGTANLSIKPGRSGRIEDVTVKGKFAGTPTGTCVEAAVRTAKVPPSDGSSFDYPVFLR